MSFEIPSTCDPEKKEISYADSAMPEEAGVLRKIANSPLAKKMVVGLGLMTGVAAFNLATANKAEAGLGSFLKEVIAEHVQGPIKGALENSREDSRQKRRDQRNYERAQYEKGRAQALEEISKNGRPRVSSWGTRKTDRNQDDYYRGYMSEVRRWEREKNRRVIEEHRKRGRVEGGQRYNEDVGR